MQTNLYTVYDRASATHGTIFGARSAAECKRMVIDAANDPNTLLARHPNDYSLYYHGTFDDNSGVIVPQDKPVFVASLEQLLTAFAPKADLKLEDTI